jgi:ABC-type Fe3+/spermidine/putrescine transport system ATPase subunit/ABC-type sulfate transport system permease component
VSSRIPRRAGNPLPWLGGLLALYLLAPIVAFAVRLGGGVSSAPGMFSALLTSLLTATITAVIVAVLGTPLAYLLARNRSAISRLLLALIALPLALPPLMSGILLLDVVGPLTLPGELFGGKLTDSYIGIVLAQTFVAAPFLIIAARAAFAAVDPALEDVAATLGHGRTARFAKVAVPAALPGIGAGLMLTWLRAFGEFGATLILAYHPYSLPVFTYVRFDETGLPATMAPIAAALAAALIVLLATRLPLPRPLALPIRGQRPARMPPARPPAQLPARPDAPLPPARDAAPLSPAPLHFAFSKRLGGFSLSVAAAPASPRLALLGPSGAGKTLTLRLLAGLVAPDGESRLLAGTEALHTLPPERREIGYVPQQPALMPRRTVWSQVTLGVRADPELAAWWIERLGLTGLQDRCPDELSGGQQRRVALARALAARPRVLLLDEPFTGLDAPVRDRLRRDLRRLQQERNLCTVIVTHDPEEAALLADEIVVLGEGRVLQAGTRESVFAAPCSPRVAGLLGIANVHQAVSVAPGRIRAGSVDIAVAGGELPSGTPVSWCIRPERVTLDDAGDYEGALVDDVDLGSTRELTVALGNQLELAVRTASREALRLGAPVRLRIAPQDVAVWAVGESDEAPPAEAARPLDAAKLRA